MSALSRQLKNRQKSQTTSIQKSLKNISIFDRVAKKKWIQLFDKIKQQQNPEIQQRDILIKNRVHTQEIEPITVKRKNSKIKPGKICKQNIRRLKTFQSINTNSDIFYRKLKVEFPHNQTSNLMQQQRQLLKDNLGRKSDLSFLQNQDINLSSVGCGRNERKQEMMPFMLRRRSQKTQKVMNIIDRRYKTILKEIEYRGRFRYSLSLQQKYQLIENMKGTKLYYRFIKQWSTSQAQII